MRTRVVEEEGEGKEAWASRTSWLVELWRESWLERRGKEGDSNSISDRK
jgi:hypothetical protein